MHVESILVRVNRFYSANKSLITKPDANLTTLGMFSAAFTRQKHVTRLSYTNKFVRHEQRKKKIKKLTSGLLGTSLQSSDPFLKIPRSMYWAQKFIFRSTNTIDCEQLTHSIPLITTLCNECSTFSHHKPFTIFLISAPALIRNDAQSKCPPRTAKSSAEHPCESSSSTSAPQSSKS